MDRIVVKFGGSSVADAGQFRKVRDIVLADPRRSVVVVSAPGKRFSTRRATGALAGMRRPAARLSCDQQALLGDA